MKAAVITAAAVVAVAALILGGLCWSADRFVTRPRRTPWDQVAL